MKVLLRESEVISVNVGGLGVAGEQEAPDDIVLGDRFENGEWVRCGKRPEPIMLTPKECRQQEYETNPLIEWEGESITVDQANIIFIRYFAEGNQKAEEIQSLIIVAKESIRQMYADEQ